MRIEGKLEVSGNLNKKIKILRNAETPDGFGGFVEGLVLVKDCRASIKPLRAKEIFEAGQVQQETSCNIMIRYFNGLRNSDIISYRQDNYEINSIINIDEADEFYELLCTKVGN